MFKYWDECPPVHVAAARIASILEAVFTAGSSSTKVPTAAELLNAPTAPMPHNPESQQQGNVADLVAMFPTGTISV